MRKSLVRNLMTLHFISLKICKKAWAVNKQQKLIPILTALDDASGDGAVSPSATTNAKNKVTMTKITAFILTVFLQMISKNICFQLSVVESAITKLTFYLMTFERIFFLLEKTRLDCLSWRSEMKKKLNEVKCLAHCDHFFL